MVPRPPWRLVLGSRRKGEGGVEGSVSTFPPPASPPPKPLGTRGGRGGVPQHPMTQCVSRPPLPTPHPPGQTWTSAG